MFFVTNLSRFEPPCAILSLYELRAYEINAYELNPVRIFYILIRSVSVTNFCHYELYLIRTLAYEPSLKTFFSYEP